MKTIVILIVSFFCFGLQANPFTPKLDLLAPKQQKKKPEKALKTIPDMFYLGKIRTDNLDFGILIFQNQQYLVENNEKLQGFLVTNIKNEYILLKKEQELYRINVYK